MKKAGLLVIMTLIFAQLCTIEMKAEIQEPEGKSKKDDNSREVVIGRDFMKFTDNDTSVNIRVKDRGISILESLEGNREVKFEKYPQDSWNDQDNQRQERRRNRFRGNWSGIEFGYNNYTASGADINIPDAINYMTLHSGKSHNFNFNFAQLNLGLTRHIGFVTGLGLNWNNYRFDANNNIVKGATGIIEELNPGAPLEKSKLTTLYLDLPFMLEFQLPVGSNHLNIAAGPIGAVKVASHSKMVFEESGQKVKSNSDFSLNMLRYGGTARVGFANFQIYGTYYKTPLFRTGKGPAGYNLYPFEIGVALTFND